MENSIHRENPALDPDRAEVTAWLPAILQISDSAFPTGGYAHSLGFESLAASGHLPNEAALLNFLRSHTIPAITHTDLPLVRAAHAAARNQNLPALLEIDALAGAMKLTYELRTASLRTGRQRLAALKHVCPDQVLLTFEQACRSDPRIGHHTVVWGIACSAAPIHAALTAWFCQSLAGICLAAPKFMRLGQEGAQRVLAACLTSAAASIDHAMTIALDDAGWFDPVLDLASMQHEIADGRLFIS